MSRAFVKEEVEAPVRSGRHRSPSGLPPGAINYITARGAGELRHKAREYRERGDEEAAASIEEALASASIVDPPQAPLENAVFGTRVTARLEDDTNHSYGIVGVDEVTLYPNAVSWVSPIGRALLGAELGQEVSLDESTRATIAAIEPL